LQEARAAGVELEAATLEYQFRKTVERLARRFEEEPENLESLLALTAAAGLLPSLPFGVSLWTVQNICSDIVRTTYPDQVQKAKRDKTAKTWVTTFRELAVYISLKVE